jgi:type IV pilus assembly protein PilC
MLIWPVPMFRGIFEDFGVPLPGPTLALLWLSDVAVTVLHYWLPTVIVLASLGTLVCLLRFIPGRPMRTRVFQMIPFVGTAIRYVGMSEFCSLLSILLECRVPLPEALRLTADAIRDPNLAEGSRLLAEDVEAGIDADDSVRHLPHFPLTLASMFRWSGRETALAQGLRAAGELFALQARVQAGVMGVFVQPLVFVGVAFAGGLVMWSLFMPLFSLLNELA